MLHRALCLLLLASSAGCAADVQPVFGGAEAIATIRDPATVQAYRLSSPSYQQQKLADYTMAAGPVEVSAAQASQLHGLLLDRATYEWDTAKGCIPNYGVRLHFQREKDEVDVLLCFECDMLAVYHNGQRVGSEDDFDNARPQLAAVVKELFPNDEAIQSLK